MTRSSVRIGPSAPEDLTAQVAVPQELVAQILHRTSALSPGRGARAVKPLMIHHSPADARAGLCLVSVQNSFKQVNLGLEHTKGLKCRDFIRIFRPAGRNYCTTQRILYQLRIDKGNLQSKEDIILPSSK